MDCIKNKVNEELIRGNIGSNSSCPYHPTHFPGQNCSFCYCPFYPCMKEFLGKSIINKKTGKTVWDCSTCTFIHDNDVVEFIFAKFKELGITDADDPKIPQVLEMAVSTFMM